MNMKKTVLLVSAAFLTLGNIEMLAQGVYQMPNSDFNTWISDEEPGNGWNSFDSAEGSLSSMKGASPAPSKEKGRSGNDGDYSVKLISKNLVIAKANGNLTTGIINMGSTTPTDASNYNFSKREDPSHSLLFAGRPDAVEFYAKFTPGYTKPFSKGPNTSPARGQFILHGDVDYRDPEIGDQESYKVGIASVLVTECSDWTRFSAEFTYSQETPDTQYMLASFTTNLNPGESYDDEFWIDDVKLLYYHALENVSYKGQTLAFDENNHVAVTGMRYDAATLSTDLVYTKIGVGASVETSFNEETYVLTITVKGNDISANPESFTSYTVQFPVPLNSVLSAAAFGEEAVTPVEGETVAVNHIYNAEKFTLTCEADADADIKREFDEETGLLTVTVTGSDASYYTENVHTYKFQFNLPLNSVLSTVTFDGEEYAIDAKRIVVIDHLYNTEKFEAVSEADPEAEISCDYDEATGLLTVTVTGSDVDENPENVHTYKYQFNVPFNSEISSVTYAGEKLDLADGETTVVDHIYKEGQLDVVCAGDQNATVEESYDPETGLLTVTVTGSDVDENPDNVHVYKFQFNLPLNSVLSGVTYEGKEIAFSETETTTIEGSYDKDAFSFECEGDADATIEQEYDEETRTVTITVSGSDADENAENVHVYKFQFTVAVGINSLFTTSAHDVYTLSGVLVRKNATTLSGLPAGVYVVAGKKVLVK